MKKRFAFILILVLLFTLFGCSAEPEEKDPIQEYVENQKEQNDAFVGFNKDEAEMKDPLVLCVDVEYVQELDGSGKNAPAVILNDFLYTLEQSGGVSDVEILYLPKHGPDRETRLDRLRVEIMSGSGPDVFIMNTCGPLNNRIEGSEPLFRFPEQAMENGLFLPLDDYIENHTRFTEWDKQTPAVLAAGRNEEGQQIIPLTYTMPLLCIRKSDVDADHTGKTYTWDDMLHDPEISPYMRLMADCCSGIRDEVGDSFGVIVDGSQYIEFALGQLADFETEELAFTEEELLQHIMEARAMFDEQMELGKTYAPGTVGTYDYYCTWLGWDMISSLHVTKNHIKLEEPKSMFPLYSDDGGVTATILSWAAVSRNTNKPDDAYVVIDTLLRDHIQKGFQIYDQLLVGSYSNGIPMHEGLLHPDMPFGRGSQLSLTEENYKEWCEVRGQITRANFHSALSVELNDLMQQCTLDNQRLYGLAPEEGFTTVEEEVHEIYEKMQRMVRE